MQIKRDLLIIFLQKPIYKFYLEHMLMSKTCKIQDMNWAKPTVEYTYQQVHSSAGHKNTF